MTQKIKNSNIDADIVDGAVTLETAIATGDFLLVYDASANTLRKVTQDNFLNFANVTSVSPTNLTSGDGTGNYTVVITGTGLTGATGSLVGNDGTSYSFDTHTVDSNTQITGVIAKSSLPGTNEPFDVKVVKNNITSTLENQINIDAQPVFSTAAGSLGTTADADRASFSAITIFASDPESGGDVTYTLESGSLPSGLTGTSTSSGYVISGTPNAVSSDTTSNFTIRAKDVNSNTSDRAYSLTIQGPIFEVFNSSGTFSVPTGVSTVDVLVVAGGGAGGDSPTSAHAGGGGGGGGLIYRPGFPVTPGGTVTVTVGDGATSPGGDSAYKGQPSGFGTLFAVGGGGGRVSDGGQGGSGGGGGSQSPQLGGTAQQAPEPGDSGNYGFGNPGGNGNESGGYYSGGGGGGAGGGGQNAPSNAAGNGGNGKLYTIADGSTPVGYAGGGGGAARNAPGGASSAGNAFHGGGAGGDEIGTSGNASRSGADGTANRGGGGGGAHTYGGSAGNGGKGVVIVRWS